MGYEIIINADIIMTIWPTLPNYMSFLRDGRDTVNGVYASHVHFDRSVNFFYLENKRPFVQFCFNFIPLFLSLSDYFDL